MISLSDVDMERWGANTARSNTSFPDDLSEAMDCPIYGASC